MSNEDIGKLLKHPLVIVVAVFLAALAFYYIASPYQNCYRNQVERRLDAEFKKVERRLDAEFKIKVQQRLDAELKIYVAEQDAANFCVKHSW